MKKAILILVVIFSFSYNCYAQGAYYELKVNGRVSFSGSTCGNNSIGGLQWIAGEYENGDHITFAQGNRAYPDRGKGLRDSNFDRTINFTENNKIIRLKLFTTKRNRRGRNCRGTQESRSNFLISTCTNKNYAFSSLFLNQPGNVKVVVTPIITLPPQTSTNIGSDDLFVIPPINGVLDSFFNWEYSFNGVSWTNFPVSFQNKNFINTTKVSQIISGSTGNNHGRVLHIRVNTNCNNSFSDVIEYDYKISAPHIISRPLTTKTTCYDAIDGTAKIQFDRPLNTGETLSITLEKQNQITGVYEAYSPDMDGDNNPDTNPLINITTLESGNIFNITNLLEGNYKIQLLGFYNGFNTYTEGAQHSTDFVISKPTPVEFSTSKVDVWCNDGSDGEIAITAQGGQNLETYEYMLREVGETKENWIPFSTTASFPNIEVTETHTGLKPAIYEIKVRDSNGCIAKVIQKDGSGQIIGLGAEITETIEIIEPDNPVAIDFVFSVEPTAFGFSDGRIRAQITGGTPLADGKYNYTWSHSNGTTWTTFTDEVRPEGWFLTLENAISGTYTLTVTDANYASATDTAGCTVMNARFTLNEPPLLKLSLVETNPISCNNTNTFGDPWSDGEFTAIASGGVPLDPSENNGLDYYYEWKKETSPGVWTVLPSQTSDVASGLDAGNYSVNIKDGNDITIGTALNNVIIPVDVTDTLLQPDLLQIALTKIDAFCNQGNDGSIDATITGGTGNYTTKWNTGATTEDLDTLVAGTYTIDVTDDKGCQAQATITIDEPTDPLVINYAFFAPTFTGATNGWIEATVTGGTPLTSGAYTYFWEDASGTNLNAQVTQTINATSYVIKLNDLGVGLYNLTIEDKNHPLAINETNCTIINSDYELFEPKPLSAAIQIYTPISCNSSNTYGNPFGDGALEVVAEGGVELQPTDNNGLPYYYTWKKETTPGVWTVLNSQTTNIASNLDAGNYAVNIEDANGIIIGNYINNVLANATDVTYLFEEPTLLELTIEKQDVYCFNGSDSWAKAIITGGTPPYDILWSNGDTTVQTSNLSQGVYDVAIIDSRGCQVDGSIKIDQPTKSLKLEYTAFATPSTGGASDGWIEAQITGGTDFPDGSYTYYWLDEAANILNTQTTTSIVGGVFQVRLNNIPKGSYYVTIEDANYPLATTGDGCTIIDDEFILYDPIEAVISMQTPISCNQDNMFNNPYSNGALQVAVTGGLPFTTGQPYLYYWKKENASGGFDDLNQNLDVATGLSNGNYALNVEDSRGVVIGIYESLNLINATDAIFNFVEPELLEVSLTATEISCGSGNNGTAIVAITGGIAPYIIAWSNGEFNTNTATNLIAGNHFVVVTDFRGCQASGNVTINQPGGLNIEIVTQTNPTCFQGDDGVISLDITGGMAPYTYSWNTNATTTSINNLSEGTYTFKLTDANGCTTFTEVILENTDEIIVDLGVDRTLCIGQSHDLDGSILDANATYVWTSNNGFTATTAKISVSEAGTYQVVSTSSLGCTATDEIVISVSDTEIDNEFLISSQAYIDEDVILLNVSNPIGETSEWIIPDNVTIIDETQTTITLRFPEVETYQIGLISTQGDCYQDIYKNIVVEHRTGLPSAGDSKTQFIEEFIISPNPNNGTFEVHIELAESSPVALRIFDKLGSFVFLQPTLLTTNEYIIPISLNLAAGTYLVVLETAQETQIKRLITY